MCKAVSVKPEVQWRLLKLGEARSLDHLRKAAVRMQKQLKREAVGATTIVPFWWGHPDKPFGVHYLPQISRGAGSGTGGCNVCLVGVWTCFGPIPL